jgi:hypothetical protein
MKKASPGQARFLSHEQKASKENIAATCLMVKALVFVSNPLIFMKSGFGTDIAPIEPKVVRPTFLQDESPAP